MLNSEGWNGGEAFPEPEMHRYNIHLAPPCPPAPRENMPLFFARLAAGIGTLGVAMVTTTSLAIAFADTLPYARASGPGLSITDYPLQHSDIPTFVQSFFIR